MDLFSWIEKNYVALSKRGAVLITLNGISKVSILAIYIYIYKK
jgi:hypothetical protein